MEHGRTFSPLALVLLSLLTEGPKHPYRMQQLIRGRGKDDVVNVRQRTSIYQTIERLRRDGLVRVQEVAREEGRPDRTIYAITDAGREAVIAWVRDGIASPKREFPIFPAVISQLPLLTPEDALIQLEARHRALLGEIARLDQQDAGVRDVIPRLFLLEDELLRASAQSEADWVAALIADLRAGRLTWDKDWLERIVRTLEGPQEGGEG